MKEVFSTHDPNEAFLVRGLLENAGIAAVVQNEPLSQMLGEVIGDMMPRVCIVDDSKEKEALEIIADWEHEEPDAAPWTCPKCGEKIEGHFTSCWECGTERPDAGSSAP
jgi:hypothetical protein